MAFATLADERQGSHQGENGRAVVARLGAESGAHGAAPRRPVPSAPETVDDTGCHILHIDMDAFYASVEIRDRPEIADKPVIVAHTGGRGVVLSANYIAREFGVHSAMPASRAMRLCPHAVFVEPRHGVYGAVSGEVMAIFQAVTPEVEPLSLDEAFLDVAGALRRVGRPAAIGQLIRDQVADELGITCSVGIASSKFIAKLASVHCKPDGLLVIPADRVLEFLHPLPVSALWGVGERTGKLLARLGLRTVGDLANAPTGTLERELGKAVAAHLAALAWGRDDRKVVPDTRDKSVGAEETFANDIGDPEVIKRELLRLSGRTAKSLRSSGLVAKTISIKLRRADFTTITRSRTLAEPTDVAQRVYAIACDLYAASGLADGTLLRLVGVRAAALSKAMDAGTQLMLDQRPDSWREAETAVDEISRRFGPGSVSPGTLVAPASRDRAESRAGSPQATPPGRPDYAE
ncbi:MAG TPA: DNA polymerase IV [Streptosporangiaceae bacterium]|nr:DNA polymerase IV [Streptosporangiaceae bacterium]